MSDRLVPLSPEVLVPRFGDYLVDKGIISEEDLNRALSRQHELKSQRKYVPLGQIMVELGVIDRTTLDQTVAELFIQLRSALQEANQQLERRVQQRTSELEQALRQLSELNQLKSNFVANISHELRTPLTHMKGYLDLLINHDLGPLELEQEKALQTISRSTERLERVIEDLILFSMTERGPVTLRSRPFYITQVCQASFGRAQVTAREHRVRLELMMDHNQEFPRVEGDEEKIAWVILQLLDNAIKFTPLGGIVTLKLETEGSFVRISVTDTGIGIPKERIPEIFEPFHQLDSSSTRRYGGTGLGLALVQKIIEAHGSLIHVSSEPGTGSRFEFLLKSIDSTS